MFDKTAKVIIIVLDNFSILRNHNVNLTALVLLVPIIVSPNFRAEQTTKIMFLNKWFYFYQFHLI